MTTSLYLDLPFSLIQSVRLAHAVMETSYEVCLASKDEEKFLLLKEKFGAKYRITTELPSKLSGIKISHKEPQTSVGSIERPLVFPHSIFSYCKSLWSERRDIRFSFAGLITESRKDFFKGIIELNYPKSRVSLENFTRPNLLSKLQSKVEQKLGIQRIPRATKFRYDEIVFWSSKRGRTFPVKAWDDEYFRLLANSEFILCPSGDYTWTYRFFEATMCGAIPIIENYCSAYNGFRFRTIEELMSTMNWSREDAEHNYNLCRSRLTVPIDLLQEEIASLLSVH